MPPLKISFHKTKKTRKNFLPDMYLLARRNEAMIRPNKSDVLLGRGGNNNKNEGNEQLRLLCRKQASKYAKSSKKEKALIIDCLLRNVFGLKQSQTRFLFKNKDSGYWEVASRQIAREKVSQALRDAVYELEREKNDIMATAAPDEHQSYSQIGSVLTNGVLVVYGENDTWENSHDQLADMAKTAAPINKSTNQSIILIDQSIN